MIAYTFEQSEDEQYFEATRATLLEAAQPTIDALRSYFENK
jgi:hypothetical protein